MKHINFSKLGKWEKYNDFSKEDFYRFLSDNGKKIKRGCYKILNTPDNVVNLTSFVTSNRGTLNYEYSSGKKVESYYLPKDDIDNELGVGIEFLYNKKNKFIQVFVEE